MHAALDCPPYEIQHKLRRLVYWYLALKYTTSPARSCAGLVLLSESPWIGFGRRSCDRSLSLLRILDWGRIREFFRINGSKLLHHIQPTSLVQYNTLWCQPFPPPYHHLLHLHLHFHFRILPPRHLFPNHLFLRLLSPLLSSPSLPSLPSTSIYLTPPARCSPSPCPTTLRRHPGPIEPSRGQLATGFQFAGTQSKRSCPSWPSQAQRLRSMLQ
jgi:hypothetical protein